MYDELIKTLRLRAALWEKMYDEDTVLKQAADAIEERCQQVDKFAEEAARLYAKLPRWIPVTERLPNNEDEVVAAFKNSADGEWWYRIDNFVDGEFYYNKNFNRHIEYWIPLPEPPKES